MKNTKTNLIVAGIVALMPVMINSVNAKNSNNIEQLQKEINALKKRIDDISSQDKYSEIKNHILNDIKFYGKLHLEVLDSSNDGNTYSLLGGNVAEKRYINSQITSLEFGGQKKLSEKSSFVFKIKSTQEYIKFKEVFLSYNIMPKLTVDFGQISINSSLEDENSSNGESLISDTRYYSTGDLFFTKGVGIKLKYNDIYGGFITGVYGNSYTDKISEINRTTFNFRGYINPYKEENNVIHLGASYFNSVVDDSKEHKIPDQTPQDFKQNKNLSYTLKQTESMAIEFAANYNWFNFQTEYMKGYITPSSKLYQERFNISNYYARVGFMLTGETIEYRHGSFGNVKVANPINEGGFGAFELSFRFANTDLQDIKSNKMFDYGKYEEYSASLSWIPMDFVKIVLQYSKIEEKFINPFAITVNNNDKNNDYNVVALKGKIFF